MHLHIELFCLPSAQMQNDTHLDTAGLLGVSAALVSVICIAGPFCSNVCIGLLVRNQDRVRSQMLPSLLLGLCLKG